MGKSFKISVPCSSANIGPGFDVIGLALSVYLEMEVRIDESAAGVAQNCQLSYEGEGAENLPLEADKNLITRTALYVMRCNGVRTFPATTFIHIKNPIPLGRGLGSSGAAVVGGIMLGNAVAGLGLSKERMMDYCLMIERHPDNVMAAMMGGFVGSYLRDLDEKDTARKEIPLSEVLPEPAGGIDTGVKPPEPPMAISNYIKFDWCREIKAVAIIPNFELATSSSRSVLPATYAAKDVIFNIQRVAVLTSALCRSPPSPDLIYAAMQDKIHQPYRKHLIPGLSEVLAKITPQSNPGLLGICLSGAGPTILALATENFDAIAADIIAIFAKENVQCAWKLLDPAYDGATCVDLA
ncbi:GHMP kinase [Dipodascopsis tothii]|uniref:GHMP kinase n=1 Tax=Dipodascopsis tothii TaxID=44089 RepID=UPI0034CED583